LGHLSEKIKNHDNYFKHLKNDAILKVFCTTIVFDKSGHKIGIQRHNKEMYKNSYILKKILNCIKLCELYYLP